MSSIVINNFEQLLNKVRGELTTRTEEATQLLNDLETARACIKQLQTQVEGLQADKERLDWLEKAAEHNVHAFRNASGTITVYINEAPTDNDFAKGVAPTVREAVDKAREVQP